MSSAITSPLTAAVVSPAAAALITSACGVVTLPATHTPATAVAPVGSAGPALPITAP